MDAERSELALPISYGGVWTGSAGMWNVKAKRHVRIRAFSVNIQCVDHCRNRCLEIWYNESPEVSTEDMDADEWNIISLKSLPVTVVHHRVALSQPVDIIAGHQANFYVWAGGEDIIRYNQRNVGPHENAHMWVGGGKFLNFQGSRFSELESTGELMGIIHYQCPIHPLELEKSTLQVRLAADIGSLFGSGHMTDVTLVIGTGRAHVPVHGAILSVRSKVFSTMLQTGMREAKTREVVIEDVEVDVVQQMLRFMYTCDVEQSVLEDAFRTLALLRVAHRFEVLSLVELCLHALGSLLEVESVPEILVAAELLQCDVLQKACVEFVIEHADEVQHTESFKRLAEKHPQLMIHLFTAAVAPRKRQRMH